MEQLLHRVRQRLWLLVLGQCDESRSGVRRAHERHRQSETVRRERRPDVAADLQAELAGLVGGGLQDQRVAWARQQMRVTGSSAADDDGRNAEALQPGRQLLRRQDRPRSVGVLVLIAVAPQHVASQAHEEGLPERTAARRPPVPAFLLSSSR